MRPTSFIGREHEIAELVRLLGRTRLLTLTGAGGVGKTRLAMQTAAEIADRYPEGVWAVELAPLHDPSLVVREVAASVGVREQPDQRLADSLAEFLRPRQALIVLDNCEHLVDACAQLIDALLYRCPRLQILATSREPLNVDGETAWRVPSLAVPDLHRLPPPDRLVHCEAVELFVERASSALRSFRLTEQNAPAVALICHRVDGIPLALELAAARIPVLSAEQMAARLDNLFQVLTAGSRTALPRQRTLRATVDWSYELLSEPERRLFDRLSVFAGGWTLEAAEAIGAGADVREEEVLDLLAHLVDKSLVLAEQRGAQVRYRLLEPMRQYGAERLLARGEEATVRGRHLHWFAQFAAHGDQELRGPSQLHWLDRLEEELDNLRAALEWADNQQGECEIELELCASLALFWYLRDYIPEGRQRLERAVARPVQPPAARMRALAGAGWLTNFQGEQTTARAAIGESLDLARELGDLQAEAWALYLQGRTHYFDHDATLTRTLGEESLTTARAAGDIWLEAWAIHLLGIAAYLAGDYPTARAHEEEHLRLRRQIGDEANALVPCCWIGMAAHRERAYAQAIGYYTEYMEGSQRLGLRWHLGLAFAAFAALAAEFDLPEPAAELAGAVARQSETIGVLPIPPIQALLEEGLERVRHELRPETYTAVWSRGVAMSEDEAIARAIAVAQFVSQQLAANAREEPALAVTAATPSGERSSHSAALPTRSALQAGLTERELEILRLVAAGKSSSQIAEDLVLSVRTVERHISNIYGKLDVRTRAQATAYAHTHGLINAG